MEYAIFTLLLLFFGTVLCAIAPTQIRNCFVAGLLIAPLGPTSEFWFLADYWKRSTILGTPISIEDVLFGFAIGALSIVLPYVILHIPLDLQFEKIRKKRLFLGCVAIIACMVLGTTIGGVNSIFVSALSFWLITVYAIVWERVPILVWVTGGCLTAVYFFLGYGILEAMFPGVVSKWCYLCNPSGIRIGFLNVEEIMWDFSWGAVAATVPFIFFRGAVHGESGTGPATARVQKNQSGSGFLHENR